MNVYTDNISYFEQTFQQSLSQISDSYPKCHSDIETFALNFFQNKKIVTGTIALKSIFEHFFVKRDVSFSQFDFLIQKRKYLENLTGGIICFAGVGGKFHGFRQRKWLSLSGNIHLSLMLKPQMAIHNADAAFLILGANAVVQTLQQLQRLNERPMIKWVNDILIKKKKVGGVIAQTQIQGAVIERVFLGIGINVSHHPVIRNDSFVEGATAINTHINGRLYRLPDVFWPLLANIEKNYRLILQNKYDQLLHYYIQNSLVIGKFIEIYSDPADGQSVLLAKGRVSSISDKLELILSSTKQPIRKGRIVFKHDEI